MCDEAVDECLAELKFFVTSKMIKKPFTALFADEKILYFNEDSSNVTFCCNQMGILSVNLNNINLDDTNYQEDDSDTIVLIRLLAWHIKSEKRKALKKKISEELMPIAWHPKRWYNFCISEDEKKEIDPIFIEELWKCVLVVCNIGVLKHFAHWDLFKSI